MPARVFFGLRQLERLQDFVSSCLGIRKTFQSGCKRLKLVVAEVAVSGTCCQDEIVVSNRHILPVGVANKYAFLILVHSRRFAQDDRRILLLTKNAAGWRRNLARRQTLPLLLDRAKAERGGGWCDRSK